MKLEALGSLVALAGGVVCAMAPDHDQHPKRVVGNNDVNNGSKTSFTGDLICFATSFTAAAYLIIAQRLRAKLDMSVFMFLMYTISSLLVLSFIILNQTEPVSLSFHPVHGIFGWMNPMLDRLPLELWMVLVCNFVGGIGFVEALKYFSPVVISVVMLAEPAIAMLEGVVAGVSPLPEIQTWVGDVFVVLGSVLAILSGIKKSNKEKPDPPQKRSSEGPSERGESLV